MKNTYLILRPTGEMTEGQAKIANRVEKVIAVLVKLIFATGALAVAAFILIALFVGVQELPNRFNQAMTQIDNHQLMIEKFKANSSNE